MNDASNAAGRAFTIGHSNHPIAKFLDLLRQVRIEVVVDTRSVPKSKFASQFDLEPLKRELVRAGIQYVYLGRELGGRPRGEEYYDRNGHVLYDRVAASASFRDGVSRLESGLDRFRVALLCAEEDPTGCHRRLLVGRVLLRMGVDLQHIRADGRLQPEAELVAAEEDGDTQLALFDCREPDEWKSIPSVSLKKRLRSFSAS